MAPLFDAGFLGAFHPQGPDPSPGLLWGGTLQVPLRDAAFAPAASPLPSTLPRWRRLPPAQPVAGKGPGRGAALEQRGQAFLSQAAQSPSQLVLLPSRVSCSPTEELLFILLKQFVPCKQPGRLPKAGDSPVVLQQAPWGLSGEQDLS